ncbi:MAG: hypothetical protein KatS3mg026_1581 [Bacteroidia bacterium]|nr:MAG: hypothetical protein KatS3mg026_1581 [Bacteroidia bacterium]
MQQPYRRSYSEAELPQVVQELQAWGAGVRRWFLVGPLGAGKTHLVRAWIGPLVSSPTFTYIHHYPGAVHVDLYRFPLEMPSRLGELEELLEEAPLIFVEWADRWPGLRAWSGAWVLIRPEGPERRHLVADLKPPPLPPEP